MSQERKPYWVRRDDGGYSASTHEGFTAVVTPESRYLDTAEPPVLERGWRWQLRQDNGVLLLDGYHADLGAASRQAWRVMQAMSAAYRKGKAAAGGGG